MRNLRVRLRPGIVVLMLAVMLPLTAIMTGILYRQNAQLIQRSTEGAMNRASLDTLVAARGLLAPIARTVELDAALGRSQWADLRQARGWGVLRQQLDQLPEVYSLYYGFDNGGFLQAVRLPAGTTAFGPFGKPPPARAVFVVRSIAGHEGQLTDSYVYLTREGEVVGAENAPAVTYDPRRRSWYAAATAVDGVANSGLYVFSGTGRPGITLSQKMLDDDGNLIGVFGADLSTDSLAGFLRQRRVGLKGVTFIADSQDVIVGYPDPAKAMLVENGTVTLLTAKTIKDPLVNDAVRRHEASGSDQVEARATEGADERYIAAFSRLTVTPGTTWTVGVIADEDEFAAPLKQASLMILGIGAIALTLGALGIFYASRLLTRPIAGLIRETQLIRQLELDGPVGVHSPVSEISEMAEALDGMKHTLRSFGLYVPKELVREIVNHGGDAERGGGMRPLTVMFTDLADFTRTSEGLTPEDVLERLSAYFDTMSRAILVHRGTIDKFIGDAIMALWNAPTLDPDHPANACLAALACKAAAAELNREMETRGLPPFRTRYGIHSGEAVVGSVGSAQRLQYTALGAMVNLASRVEGVNKRFHTEILITGEVNRTLGDRFLVRPLGPVTAAGTSQPVALFELLGTKGEGSPYPATPTQQAMAKDWETAFRAYRREEWEIAAELLTDYCQRYPEDDAGTLLLNRCEAFVVSPPPGDWDGALVFYAK